MERQLELIYENSDKRYEYHVKTYSEYCYLYTTVADLIKECIESCVFNQEHHFMVHYERSDEDDQSSRYYNVKWVITSSKESFFRKLSLHAKVVRSLEKTNQLRHFEKEIQAYGEPKSLDDLFLNIFVEEDFDRNQDMSDGVLVPLDYWRLSLPSLQRFEIKMTKSIDEKNKKVNIYYESVGKRT